MPKEIIAKPLNRKEFEPFGEVIEIDSTVEAISINDGYAIRYNDLATVDVLDSGGRPLINIFRCKPRPLPITIHMMECHPLASQAFISLQKKKFLVVVAPPGESVDPENLTAFVTNGFQLKFARYHSNRVKLCMNGKLIKKLKFLCQKTGLKPNRLENMADFGRKFQKFSKSTLFSTLLIFEG